MPFCAACTTEYQPPVYRNTLCSSCGKELKTCTNCRHYSPGAANDCLEPVSEPVREKDRANFCDWFIPAEKIRNKSQNSSAARRAFDSLFDD